MALGAAATGARAATGSTGQGIALMQETIAEAALNELPLVVFNMAPRPAGLLPVAPAAAAGATTARSPWRPRASWRRPSTPSSRSSSPTSGSRRSILYGDHMIGFTQMTVEQRPARRVDAAAREALGARRQPAAAPAARRSIWTWRQGKHNTPGPGPDRHWQQRRRQVRRDRAASRRGTSRATSTTPSVVVVSFGTTGAFVDYVVDELRAEGHRDRHVPADHALAVPERRARRRRRGDACKLVLVYELNAGPDDRRRAPGGRTARCRCADRRREPGRVGHAPGRPARRRHHSRAHPRRDRRSSDDGSPAMTDVDLSGARKVAVVRARPAPEHRAPPLPRMRPPGRVAPAGRGARRARPGRPLDRRRRPRLLHADHHHRRRRVPPVPARPRAAVATGMKRMLPEHADLHAAG